MFVQLNGLSLEDEDVRSFNYLEHMIASDERCRRRGSPRGNDQKRFQ